MKDVSTKIAAKPLPGAEHTILPPGVERGRPTLYRPEYCQLVLDEMGKGYSIGAVAGLLRVSRQTILDWMARHDEFLGAVMVGKALRLRQWETIALGNASGKIDGNASMTTLGLKNAGAEDWTDVQTVKVVDEAARAEGDALEFIESRLAELGARIREAEGSPRLN